MEVQIEYHPIHLAFLQFCVIQFLSDSLNHHSMTPMPSIHVDPKMRHSKMWTLNSHRGSILTLMRFSEHETITFHARYLQWISGLTVRGCANCIVSRRELIKIQVVLKKTVTEKKGRQEREKKKR